MQQVTLYEAIDRVSKMESLFDTLQNAADTDPAAIADDPWLRLLLRELRQYYQGGQWLRDYEMDEMGLFPRDLKRGVLAQDAVFDLLERIGPEAGQGEV